MKLEKNTKENSGLKSEISAAESTINSVIEASYKVWYVKKGNKPDFSEYNDYYTATATFQDLVKDSVLVSPLSEKVKEFNEAFDGGRLFSFNEREIGFETTILGNIAHRTSYHIYETNVTDSITKRGVLSFQLVKIDGQWKIQSLLRQIESESYQLPEKYDSFK